MKTFFVVLASASVAIATVTGCASSPSSAPAASAPASTAVTPQQREERATATLEKIGAKDFEGARKWFDASMKDAASAKFLENTWTQTQDQYGAFKSKAFNGAMRYRGFVGLEYDLTFEKGHLRAKVVFDDDGLIAGLFLE